MEQAQVIDFQSILKRKQKTRGKNTKVTSKKNLKNSNNIINLNQRREILIQKERRTVKRTILAGFIGACVVVPKKGLVNVKIYDLSPEGMAFDMDASHGSFKSGEKIALRIYMNHDTYFPFCVQTQNSRLILEHKQKVHRHGVCFVKDAVSDTALSLFVSFIENICPCLIKDKGDMMVVSNSNNR